MSFKVWFYEFRNSYIIAVLWQKYVGTVEVSPIAALAIINRIAGIVSGFVNYFTLKESIITKE